MSDNNELNSAQSSSSLPTASTSADSSNKKAEVETIVEGYYHHLLEVLIQGECLKAYRDHKINMRTVAGSSKEQGESSATVSEPAPAAPEPGPKRKGQAKSKAPADIFGNTNNTVKKMECKCPNCFRKLAAARLAPHLEKCMSMGRDSSRVASKRIANYAKIENGTSSD